MEEMQEDVPAWLTEITENVRLTGCSLQKMPA
jgi:hypothetical protein